jgi:NNP family nitrate/nitrite transporter-like MFS transporter
MLEPLKNVQVWRFSLYYFFVFGAFVALALWLPRYLIGSTARHQDRRHDRRRLFDPGQPVPRLWRHPVGQAMARGGSCTGPSASRSRHTFMLSYPPTDYVVDGIKGPFSFTCEWAGPFTVTSSCSASS